MPDALAKEKNTSVLEHRSSQLRPTVKISYKYVEW